MTAAFTSPTSPQTTLTAPAIAQIEQANFRYLLWDIAWFGLALAATSRFLQFYAIRLGASPMELGLLAALPALVLIFATGLSQWWRARFNDSVTAVNGPAIGHRLVFLLPVFAPFFPPEWRVPWVIAAITLPAVAQGVAAAVFLVMMRETLTPAQVTRSFTTRAVAMNITVTVGVLIFGLWLEKVPFPINYQAMFVVAWIASMVSYAYIRRLKSIVPPVRPRGVKLDLRGHLRDQRFQSVALITLVTHAAFFAIFAVIPIQLESGLGATEGFLAIFGVVELLSAAVAAALTARWIVRWGSRNVIVLGMLSTALSALVIALAPDLNWTLLAAMLTGAGWSTATIAVLAYYSERTAPDDMGASVLFHQMLFAAMFVGPLIGSSLVSVGLPVAVTLLLGAGLRLLAAVVTRTGLALFGKQKVTPIYK